MHLVVFLFVIVGPLQSFFFKNGRWAHDLSIPRKGTKVTQANRKDGAQHPKGRSSQILLKSLSRDRATLCNSITSRIT